jgi:exopolysaccharide production protein ExoZ
MRAVAVFLVAWGHMGQELQSPLPNLGVFGVDIFFAISGFIIAFIALRLTSSPGPSTAWHFLKRRFIRIFPIYWVIAAIFSIRLIRHHQFSLSAYLPCILLLPTFHYPGFIYIVEFSWTLLFEMFFYYVVATVLLFTVRRAVLCVFLFMVAAVSVRTVMTIQHVFLIVFCNPLLLEFVFGVCLAAAFHRFGKRPAFGVWLLVMGSALAVTLQILKPNVGLGPQAFLNDYLVLPRVFTWGIAGAMVVGGMIFWSPRIPTRSGKTAIALGNASYSIYLSSAFGLELTNRIFAKIFQPGLVIPAWQISTAQCCGVLIIFTVGWLFYKFLELPILNVLRPLA